MSILTYKQIQHGNIYYQNKEVEKIIQGGVVIYENKLKLCFYENNILVNTYKVKKGTTVTLPSPSDVEGAREYWTIDGVVYNAGDNYTVTKNTDANAGSQLQYTVSFSANAAVDSITVDAGQSITLPSIPSKSGYRSAGWSIGGTLYAAGASYTPTKTITATASYIQQVTLTYDTGGSWTGDINTTITLASVPGKTGYTTNGWSISGTVYKGGASYKVTATVTATASYTINSYTITFNGNGGTSPSSITRNYGATLGTLPSSTRTYYTLSGWYTASSGGSKISSSTTVTGSATYYAQWSRTYANGTVWSYSYTGGMQSFTAPYKGTYTLYVWGAQGGGAYNNLYTGGKGGYSYGNVSLSAGTVVYIGVGGQGSGLSGYGSTYSNGGTKLSGGYNGGGNSFSYDLSSSGSGGGATHMGKTNAILSSTSKANLYIVAGGGGGANLRQNNSTYSSNGGAGGGSTGGSVTCYDVTNGGGSQSSGGTGGTIQSQAAVSGSYGQGANGQSYGYLWRDGHCTGGGGGLYGGGSSPLAGAGGGSGYTGGVSSASMSNGQRSGNGYAQIKLVSAS